MREVLNHLFEHKTLSKDIARQVLIEIGQGKINASQIAAFLTVFMMRNITVEELEGFRDAMLELCIVTDLSEFDPIDLCGTGGDGKDTFNISTIASFVVAGAGINVAKHGNYGVSSSVGSSNIMEYFGYKFTSDKEILRRQIDKAGICIMHAPLFHPTMKNVAGIRKELGVKTFFNMLGPMVNPAFPKKQMVGVFSLELSRLYGYLYQKSGKDFAILHSLDGYDEISLTGPFKLISNNKEQVFHPREFGFKVLRPEELSGGNSLEESAKIFRNVLNNRGTGAQEEAIIANAGVAISCARQALPLQESMEAARQSLRSGEAKKVFEKLLSISQSY
jgi:anthranilate phosphoribosyltransferase